MASPKPAVIVRREFEATPDIVAQQLRACIVGPACQLVRFNKADEKASGFVVDLGTYNPGNNNGSARALMSADQAYPIPSLASSSTFDLKYTKVFAEDALLTYAHTAHDSAGWVLTTNTNTLSLTNAAWKGAGRLDTLPQDVAVGDIVQVFTEAAGLVHTSTVTGFSSATGSASIGNIGSNQAASINSTANSVAGAVGTATMTVSTDSYLTADDSQDVYNADPRIVGKTTTNYTVTITAVTGTTVAYTVVSDTGLDNKIVSTPVASGAAESLPSGATVTLTFTTPPAVGSTNTFSITMAHTKQTFATAGGDIIVRGSLAADIPSTTYVLTCTKGGSFASTNSAGAQFKVYTDNGADVPSNFTFTGAAPSQIIPIGSYNLELFVAAEVTANVKGFVRGDVITIAVVAGAVGAIKVLTFADAYTGTTVATGDNALVRLSKKKTVEIPSESLTLNWTVTNASNATNARFNLQNVLTLRDSSVAAGTIEAYVTAGKFYLQYRSYLALPREVGSITSVADITTQLGVIDPDNPLAFGTYKAFTNANGATVHYIPVVSDSLNGARGYADALAVAKGNRNCYGLVPLSNDSAVWQAFVGHVNDESAPEVGRFRVLWIAPELDIHGKVVDFDSSGSVIYGTTKLYAGVTNGYQLDTTQVTKFTEQVQAGDYVRVITGIDSLGNETYVEYPVYAVLDNNSLVITTASNPSLTNVKIEIFRDFTSAALAQRYVQVAGGFSSERVFAVVPDRGVKGLRAGGIPVSNQYIACAYAGLRSGSRPQQPLSNVELLGFDGVNLTSPVFDEVDFDTLRDGGVWVVRNTDDGKIYAERQLSTSTLDLFRKEQSVTCNVDSISFTLADGLRNLVGRVNITEGTRGLVEAIIRSILGELSATNGAVTVGPQLNTYEITSVTVPATAQDTLKVRVSISVPLPMNIIDITLVI